MLLLFSGGRTKQEHISFYLYALVFTPCKALKKEITSFLEKAETITMASNERKALINKYNGRTYFCILVSMIGLQTVSQFSGVQGPDQILMKKKRSD